MAKQQLSAFILIFLGMLTAFGPLVTDMYLPTLPQMVGEFHTSPTMIQLGLTTCMAGLAIGQLFFGPLSDKYGRKPLLVAGMALFLASTAGCLYAQTGMQFAAWRLAQGLAGASGIVIARSVSADLFAGRELAKMLGIIGAINGVAPIAAPMCGGLLADSVGWQGIFWSLFAVGVLLLAGSLRFAESLPRERRRHSGWGETVRSFAVVLRNRHYRAYVLQFGFGHVVLFANIASAPFIMQQHYGFTPLQFSLCFGANALAIVAASALSMRFRHLEVLSYRCSQGLLAVSVLMLAALAGSCSFWVYEALLLCLLLLLGFTFASANTLAMDAERRNAGTASAVLGALGFLLGGLVPPLVGVGNVLTATGVVFCAGAAGIFVCSRHALRSLLGRRTSGAGLQYQKVRV